MALETTSGGSGSAELQDITAVFWASLLGPFPLPKLLGQKTSSFLAVFCVRYVTGKCCQRGTRGKGGWEAALGLEFFLGI